MALEQITFNLGALEDSANSGKNYVAGQVFEVFNIDDTYASIFADSAGTIPIDQSGIQNISNSDGECKFFIEKGFYNIKSDGKTRQLNANFSFEFDTVSDAVNARFISLLEGRRVWLNDRQAWFKVVLTSSVTPNGLDVIASSYSPMHSFLVLETHIQAWGLKGDGSNEQVALQNYLSKVDVLVTLNKIKIVSTEVTLRPSNVIDGLNRFADDSLLNFEGYVTFESLSATDRMFTYKPASGGQSQAPIIKGCKIISNYPLQLNNESQPVEDGSGQPPLVGGCVEHNWMVAKDGSAGNPGKGLTATKMFDVPIQYNRFTRFRTWHILLFGCDLNVVKHNRLEIISGYGYVELQTGTFGSQNEFCHNDIVGINNGNCRVVKSTNRHVIIKDNYIETTKKDGFTGTGRACLDISLDGTNPIDGVSPLTGRIFSIIEEDNRLDSDASQMDFSRIIAPDFRSLRVRGYPTTGNSHADSIFDGVVDFHYNVTHPHKSIQIVGCKDLSPNILTEESEIDLTDRLTISVDNLSGVNYRDDTVTDLTLDLKDKTFILANEGRPSYFNVVNYGANIPSVNQVVNIYALMKSTNAGDTVISRVRNDSNGVSPQVTHTLSNKYEKFLIKNCPAGDAYISESDSRASLSSSSSNSGIVKIKSLIIEWD